MSSEPNTTTQAAPSGKARSILTAALVPVLMAPCFFFMDYSIRLEEKAHERVRDALRGAAPASGSADPTPRVGASGPETKRDPVAEEKARIDAQATSDRATAERAKQEAAELEASRKKAEEEAARLAEATKQAESSRKARDEQDRALAREKRRANPDGTFLDALGYNAPRAPLINGDLETALEALDDVQTGKYVQDAALWRTGLTGDLAHITSFVDGSDPWASTLAGIYRGTVDEGQALAEAKKVTMRSQRSARACQAHVHLALHAELAGDRDGAMRFYQAALSDNVSQEPAFAWARARLARFKATDAAKPSTDTRSGRVRLAW